MIKKFIEKYICLHKWDRHAMNTDYRINKTTEILICNKCGKIHKIEY